MKQSNSILAPEQINLIFFSSFRKLTANISLFDYSNALNNHHSDDCWQFKPMRLRQNHHPITSRQNEICALLGASPHHLLAFPDTEESKQR